MEIAPGAEDDRLTIGNTFLLVRPFAGQLQRSLDRFCASVHGQDHVIPKHIRNLLGESAENGVVKCTRRQREFLCLLDQGTDDPRMAMTLYPALISKSFTNAYDHSNKRVI